MRIILGEKSVAVVALGWAELLFRGGGGDGSANAFVERVGCAVGKVWVSDNFGDAVTVHVAKVHAVERQAIHVPGAVGHAAIVGREDIPGFGTVGGRDVEKSKDVGGDVFVKTDSVEKDVAIVRKDEVLIAYAHEFIDGAVFVE